MYVPTGYTTGTTPSHHALARHTSGAYVSPESEYHHTHRNAGPRTPYRDSMRHRQDSFYDEVGNAADGTESSSSAGSSLSSSSGSLKSIGFPAFLDLVGMLAMLVTRRSGDIPSDHFESKHGNDGGGSGGGGGGGSGSNFKASPTDALQLFFFYIYSSGGLRDVATTDMALRGFFARIDRSVRLIVQRRARQEAQQHAEAGYEGSLRVMQACISS